MIRPRQVSGDELTAPDGTRAVLPAGGRLAQNVLAVYYELDPGLQRVDTLEVFRRIADLEGWSE